MLGGALVEQDLGPVVVGAPEEVDGIRFTPVDVGNPHAVVEGDPAELPRIGPAARDAPALSEPHERAGRAPPRRRRGRGARLGARRGGDGLVGHERRRGRRCARRQPGDDPFPRRRAHGADRGRPRVPHRPGVELAAARCATRRGGRRVRPSCAPVHDREHERRREVDEHDRAECRDHRRGARERREVEHRLPERAVLGHVPAERLEREVVLRAERQRGGRPARR